MINIDHSKARYLFDGFIGEAIPEELAGSFRAFLAVENLYVSATREIATKLENLNDEFKTTDAVIVIGANDVLNPAARDAVDTPIYGMPVLNVDEAKEIFICNFDLNPGYAGVENPLYTRAEGVHLYLGDAQALFKLNPFIVTIFAVIFLKEKICCV